MFKYIVYNYSSAAQKHGRKHGLSVLVENTIIFLMNPPTPALAPSPALAHTPDPFWPKKEYCC